MSLPVWDDITGEFVCFLSILDVVRFTSNDMVSKASCFPHTPSIAVGDIVRGVKGDEGVQVDTWDPATPVTTVSQTS